MKKNYNLNQENGIKKTTLLSSTIIILFVATITGYNLIKTEYDNFKNHINSFKNTLIEREKFYIKSSVDNLKNDIDFEELSIINNKKHNIKTQSILAYNLAKSIYEKTTKLDKQEQINFIKTAIKQISQKANDINYFILDTQGNLILNSENELDENQNYYNFEDMNSKKFVQEMINANTNTQNFIDYFWYIPNNSLTAKKITYSKHLKELNLIIGSGTFLEKQNSELTSKLKIKIENQNFNNEEFIFIYKINSLNDIINKSELVTKKLINPKKEEVEAMKKLLINTNYKGNDYLFYNNNQQLIYGTYLKEYRYFIAIGVNLTNIYDIVEKERSISLENMYKNIIRLVIIITIMTSIFFIFSLLFTKRIETIFQEYKENVILNEDKYHMLFNHSNDAFIISELDNNDYTRITSYNKTASKVTFYDEKELIDKEFFDLFINLDTKKILTEKSFFDTVKLKTKYDDIKTIELSIIIYEANKQTIIFASIRDITERTLLKENKEKQEKILIQKSKMASMGEMIGNIAHQWRQPLSQLSGLFFDIESAYDYKELNKKYLQNRVEEANDLLEYMSKTIDDFRNFFNPNSKKEKFFIKDSVDNAIKIVKSTLDFYHIELLVDIDEFYEINGYKNEYSQAVMNIISNAKDILIEKNIQNPQIKIYLEKNKKATLCIEDNAGGINDEIIDKIFDPYFTTKYEYGTGIGLYMTKLIIEEKMNGSISAKNTKDGAKFLIEI
ncbi:Cache sensor-containing two-component system histidine kinase [Arcobacter venerupis]|uniref:histidine kinase n=1 Tax=Arcobacter venerupis TaxID=1054033 RepID=A0AAE7B8M3_9BACT|nr:cache domain-containing protein [Arcobacter venerupis]QKF65809.1 Cache sensor-containing two-component system histidine kinase [Arcobacter venerupis]RWS50316.1 histidine kinase [Arcobacter venerupis]